VQDGEADSRKRRRGEDEGYFIVHVGYFCVFFFLSQLYIARTRGKSRHARACGCTQERALEISVQECKQGKRVVTVFRDVINVREIVAICDIKELPLTNVSDVKKRMAITFFARHLIMPKNVTRPK